MKRPVMNDNNFKNKIFIHALSAYTYIMNERVPIQ